MHFTKRERVNEAKVITQGWEQLYPALQALTLDPPFNKELRKTSLNATCDLKLMWEKHNRKISFKQIWKTPLDPL